MIATLAAHIGDRTDGLVFTDRKGGPVSIKRISGEVFPRLMRRFARPPSEGGTGLKPLRGTHGFRHTHATLLLAAGVSPHVVQRRLGHGHVATTLGMYGHVMPQQAREVAALTARLVGEKATGDVVPIRRAR